MKKIKYVSIFFKLLFQVTFVLLIVAQVAGWVYAPQPIVLFFNVIPAPYQNIVLHALDWNTKIAGFCLSSVSLLIKLVVVYSLIQLFSLYQRHEFFSQENVLYIRNAGYALLLLQIVKPLSDFFLGFILTAHNPPGLRIAMMTMSETNIGVILTSLIIILISWVMTEGRKLNDEQQLII